MVPGSKIISRIFGKHFSNDPVLKAITVESALIKPNAQAGSIAASVAAPSVHPNGKSYQWVIPPDVLSESPDWLLKLLRKQVAQTLSPDDVIKVGMRNDQLFRMDCSLRSKGMNKKDFGIELHRINQYQCEPPLSDDEVNRIIDSVNLQLNQEKLPLFRYRDYIRSEQFPKDTTLRHILHAVSFYMDTNGDKGYPTEAQIASPDIS